MKEGEVNAFPHDLKALRELVAQLSSERDVLLQTPRTCLST
jgi:hypothetical protein